MLKRPVVLWIPFEKRELVKFRSDARLAGLSQAEYGRRKILDAPMATVGILQKKRNEAKPPAIPAEMT
jgi:hypothetical protein